MSPVWIFALVATCLEITATRACMSGGSTPPLEKAKCPEIVGDANFDLNKFSGEWFSVYTTCEAMSTNAKCVRMEIGVLNDGLLVTQLKQETATNKEAISTQKFAQDSSAMYKFQPSTASTCGYKDSALPVQTIVTDYVSYAMLYSCSMQNDALNEWGILLSRTSALSDEVRNKTTAGTTIPFYPLGQSGCGC